MDQNEQNKQWHQGFYGAVELEFPIKNPIGHLFKKYKVIEYKSPNDGLTIDDFSKTMGYACLYKSLAQTTDEVPLDDITVSLVWERYPRRLMKALTDH